MRTSVNVGHSIQILFFVLCLTVAGTAFGGDAKPSVLQVPAYELPSTLELCGEPVPLFIPEVWERMEREFLISVYDHAQVYLWLRRKQRFFPAVEKELRSRTMPDDLKYLAVAESSLITDVRSYRGALGMWQFIRETGRRYDLRSNSWFEDRLHAEKATDAALNYLSDLYEEFKSWTLAAAAYNCGEKRVESVIKEQGETNYYRMDLPTETERYIFRILAAKVILSNPRDYGYEPYSHPTRYRPVEFDTFVVDFEEGIHFRTVARACGTYYKEMKALNPDIKGDYFPPGKYEIKLPKGSENRFAKFYDDYKASYVKPSFKIHVVRAGESLGLIAKRLGVTVRDIKVWNGLTHDVIHPGQQLKIF